MSQPNLPTEIDEPIEQRLVNVTTAYRDAVEVYERHRERWQETITEAIDQGLPNKKVAKLVGVSSPRICSIVARQYSRAA